MTSGFYVNALYARGVTPTEKLVLIVLGGALANDEIWDGSVLEIAEIACMDTDDVRGVLRDLVGQRVISVVPDKESAVGGEYVVTYLGQHDQSSNLAQEGATA